jgi:hypothetical protein
MAENKTGLWNPRCWFVPDWLAALLQPRISREAVQKSHLRNHMLRYKENGERVFSCQRSREGVLSFISTIKNLGLKSVAF